jgi:hypothetical protein
MTITFDGQLEFNGIVLGDNVNTFMEELTGWDDLPPIDSGNTPIPMYHGSYAGSKFARERIVTWVGTLNPEDLDSWSTVLKQIRKATTISSEEKLLTIRTIDETLTSYASVTARSLPGNRRYGAARIGNLAIQFTCSDPRKYSESDYICSISFPDLGSSGLVYPLTYPLDYGTASSGGTGSYSNDGDAPLPVIYVVHGPTENPRITNNTTGMHMSFSITLTAGETLSINTANSTVLLNDSVDRLYTRTLTSSPIMKMEIIPGVNLFSVTASSWDTSLGSLVTISGKSSAFF